MTLEEFAKTIGLAGKTELERVTLLAYFFHKAEGKIEFGRPDILTWFDRLHYSRPNLGRLTSRMVGSRAFVRGTQAGHYKLHATKLDELQQEHPGLHSENEAVVSDDTILPRAIYDSTRGYVESLSKQINASYEYNIFDGCAVLMRRLLEILLILSYEHIGIEAEIQDQQGNYRSLERIIENAKMNKNLKLSRDTKTLIDEFRVIGNFAAHKIYYNCRRADLKQVALPYRATIEELLYKCGIRK